MLCIFWYHVGIAKNHQVSPVSYFVQNIGRMQQVFILILLVLSGIARYCEGSKKHLDDPVPNGDFPVLQCLGIRSSVSGIRSGFIRKYKSKFQQMPNLRCLIRMEQQALVKTDTSLLVLLISFKHHQISLNLFYLIRT